ncbi:MAG: ParB/RepB/Spo0J family partition protein [Armatimonadetes bacterium]|nr:ParB/RepB/Spo0J family partition protein [Armatimonadota bacterium]
MRKRSLGRGLSELIPSGPINDSRALVEVPINSLYPNPMQPRADVDPDRLEELTLSIEAHGVLQPIIVRKKGDDYEIVAGERRWRAAQRAGLETVPCITQDITDEESLQLALIENLQREDLSPLEAARGYRRLINEFALTQEELARYLGKSRSAIANTLRLLDLPEEIQTAIQSGAMSEGHGRALLGLSGDPEAMLALARKIQEDGLTVREVERAVREALDREESQAVSEKPQRPRLDPNLRAIQDHLQGVLMTKVRIRQKSKGDGRIEINYSSAEELERLVLLLELLDQLN